MTDKKALLSVAILTKNEEERIRRCLESVKWADEIIVVDGVSTDRTVEICKEFGAKVISHAFEGSFALERNIGIEQAKGDWVLHIDADDIVTPEFQKAVQAILLEPQPHDAFKFRRKSYLFGRFMRYGGWHHYLPNLVRREVVRYEGLVHERPIIKGSIGIIDADIEHHPCEDFRSFIDRHNRYTTLQAQELVQEGKKYTPRQLKMIILRKPWKTFWKSYVKKRGFREGLYGLVFACLFAFIEFLKWAKYWELTRQDTGDVRSN